MTDFPPASPENVLEHAPGAPQSPAAWPRITLVTAVRNGVNFLEDTIQSVLRQDYPNLEYMVQDGASTDGTLEIIRKYEQHITRWASEPDGGVYDALNKGFAGSTGDIMGWINASDLLQPGGLRVVGQVFAAMPEVEWITGRPTKFDESGTHMEILPLPRWSRMRFLAGADKYIQQESTYWRRSLWEKAGGALSTAYRAEGDYDQWVRFFRHAPLYTVDALIGGFRTHQGLSGSDVARYVRICDEIADRELRSAPGNVAPRLFRGITGALKGVPKVRGLWKRLAIHGLYTIPGRDWPPVIVERDGKWVFAPKRRGAAKRHGTQNTGK